MTQWQYLVVQVGYPQDQGGGRIKWVNGLEDPRFGKNRTPIYKAFAVLGAEGWELVAVQPGPIDPHDPLYIFKRPDSES